MPGGKFPKVLAKPRVHWIEAVSGRGPWRKWAVVKASSRRRKQHPLSTMPASNETEIVAGPFDTKDQAEVALKIVEATDA